MKTWTNQELLTYHRAHPHDMNVWEERIRREKRADLGRNVFAFVFLVVALFLFFSWYVSLGLDGGCLNCGWY